jgi:hypothetical protein
VKLAFVAEVSALDALRRNGESTSAVPPGTRA